MIIGPFYLGSIGFKSGQSPLFLGIKPSLTERFWNRNLDSAMFCNCQIQPQKSNALGPLMWKKVSAVLHSHQNDTAQWIQYPSSAMYQLASAECAGRTLLPDR